MLLEKKTKSVFAAAFRKLLRTKDFPDIYVSDICREAGCQRGTFYYHFHDKYELSAWIFADTVNSLWDNAAHSYVENLTVILEQLMMDRMFYKKLLPDDAMSGLYKHIVHYFGQIYFTAILDETTTASMNEKWNVIVRHAAYGHICMIREWLFGEVSLETGEMAQCLYDSLPKIIKTKLE